MRSWALPDMRLRWPYANGSVSLLLLARMEIENKFRPSATILALSDVFTGPYGAALAMQSVIPIIWGVVLPTILQLGWREIGVDRLVLLS